MNLPGGKRSGAAVCFRTAFAIDLSLFFVPCLGAQPQTDYHQHLFSPRIAKLAPGLNPLSAAELIALLDKAGIQRASCCRSHINTAARTGRRLRMNTRR